MTCHAAAVFDIVKRSYRDGAFVYERMSLIDGRDSIHMLDWQPGVLGYKSGGAFVENPLAEGRTPVSMVWEDVSDTFTLAYKGDKQDRAIRAFRQLGGFLINAVEYWTTSWAEDIVWLEARSTFESNTRYAVVKSWSMPGHANPLQNPFVGTMPGTLLSGVNITLTHLPWQDTEPGTGDCVEASGLGTRLGPYHLEFVDGDDGNVNFGSDPSVDDLPDGAAFTVDTWIRADNPTVAGVGTIAGKVSWRFDVSNTNGLVGQVSCGAGPPTPATSSSGLDEFDFDGLWHHVLMTYDETGAGTPAARTIYLAVDGVWVITYVLQTASAGAYNSDAAQDLIAGNIVGLIYDFDGGIGWMRVSDNVRYDPAGGNFTPPARCWLPSRDANTVLLAIYEGSGATTTDLSGNGNNGTISNATWDDDCEESVGRTATCLDEVYCINKQNHAQLTHAFYYDASAGTFSANLLEEALPYDLLPAVPAANDIIYIGAASYDYPRYFNNVVFDTGIAQVDIDFAASWEYVSGVDGALNPTVWSILQEYNGTRQFVGAVGDESFTNTGVRSIHFGQPGGWWGGAWLECWINGVFGLWIRLTVSAVGAAPAPPTQQNRQIYTTTWNNLNIAENEVGGDIPALVRHKLRTRSGPVIGMNYRSGITRVGLRSVGRGDNFVAWLNASDVQNPVGVTCISVSVAETTMIDRPESPSGRAIEYAPLVNQPVLARRARWTLDRAIAQHYYGRFNAFVRIHRTVGNPGDITVRLRATLTSATTSAWDNYTKVGTSNSTSFFELIELGPIDLPVSTALQSEATIPIQLELQMANTNVAGATVYVYDICLLPADEWTGTFYEPVTGSSSTGGNDLFYLDIDDVLSPKDYLRSLVRLNQYGAEVDFSGEDEIENEVRWPIGHIGLDRAILQTTGEQNIWSASETWYGTGVWVSFPEIAYTARMEAVRRYLSLRGDS